MDPLFSISTANPLKSLTHCSQWRRKKKEPSAFRNILYIFPNIPVALPLTALVSCPVWFLNAEVHFFFCFQKVKVLHFPFIHSSIYSFMYWILIPPLSSSSEDVYKVSQEGPSCVLFCFFSSAWPNEVHTSSFFFSHLLSPHRRLIVPFTSLLIFFTLQVWIIRRTHICFFSALSISSLPCLTPILLYQAPFQNQSVSLSSVFSCIWWTWAVERQQTSNGRSVCM